MRQPKHPSARTLHPAPRRAHLALLVTFACGVGAWRGVAHTATNQSPARAAQQRPTAGPDAGAPARAAPVTAPCGDVVGAWSAPVNGLRARLVTRGSRVDHSALRVELELENVAGGRTPLEIHWTGRLPLGFATFHLDDASGHEVPAPNWAFGGNEPGGEIREMIPPRVVVHELVADNLFTPFNGRRAVRIGAFWGREMPTDGSRRVLRAQLVGRAPTGPGAIVLTPAVGDAGVSTRAASPADPRGRAWVGTLDVPGVCVD